MVQRKIKPCFFRVDLCIPTTLLYRCDGRIGCGRDNWQTCPRTAVESSKSAKRLLVRGRWCWIS